MNTFSVKSLTAILLLMLSLCVFGQQEKRMSITIEGREPLVYENGQGAIHFVQDDSITSVLLLNKHHSQRIIVELSEPPLARRHEGNAPFSASQKTGKYLAWEAEIRREQARFRNDLENIISAKNRDAEQDTTETSIQYAYEVVFNGMSLIASAYVAEQIRRLPYVKAVHRDTEVKAFLDQSIPVIGADRIWADYGITGRGITVGILDTGIDYLHPDLGGGIGEGFKVTGGYNFVNNTADPMDDHSHGTHVAGIVAANGQLKGVAPDASLKGYKVLDGGGSGYSSWIIAGIEQSVTDGVHILNASLGGPGSPADPMAQAMNNASLAGVVCVVAAGNDGSYFTIGSPGVAARAITVGATDNSDQIAPFSSRGPVKPDFSLKPDVLAPGVLNNSTIPGGEYERYSGTSMATPHVAGAIALFMEKHSGFSPSEIKSLFSQSALDLGYDVWTQGMGRIDLPSVFNLPGFLVSPNLLSFGMASLSETIWTTADTLVVSNISDGQQNYSIATHTPFPEGVTLSYAPENFSLLPGETKQIVLQLTVNNALVPFPEEYPMAYDAVIHIRGGDKDTRVPLSFVKSSAINLVFDEEPLFVFVFNERASSGFVQEAGSDIFIPIVPGHYEIAVMFHDYNTQLLYENIRIEGLTQMIISKADAKNALTFSQTNRTNEKLHPDFNVVYTIFPRTNGFMFTIYGEPQEVLRYNDFASQYVEYIAGATLASSEEAYLIAYHIENIHSDKAFSTTAPEYLQFTTEVPPSDKELPLVPITHIGGKTYSTGAWLQNPALISESGLLSYYLSPDFMNEKDRFFVKTDFFEFRETPFSPEYQDFHLRSALTTWGDDGNPAFFSSDWYPFDLRFHGITAETDHLFLGQGPPLFNGRFMNWDEEHFLFANGPQLFLNQYKAYKKPGLITFRFSRDGQEIRSGDLLETYGVHNQLFNFFKSEPGFLLLEFEYNEYAVAGKQGLAQARAGFHKNEHHRVIPYVQSLNIQYPGAYYTDRVGIGQGARVVFDIPLEDHLPDPLVSAYIRNEGAKTWNELSLQSNQRQYGAEIPSSLTAGFKDLKIRVSNLNGDFFEYQLEPAFLLTAPGLPEVAVDQTTVNLLDASARVSARVVSDGGSPLAEKGLIWGQAADISLNTANGKLSSGRNPGVFEGIITELQAETPYYVRAYATNNLGTAYSDARLLENIPGCMFPHNLIAQNITKESATITWEQKGVSDSWELVFGPEGFNPDAIQNTMAAQTPSLEISGLDHSTGYQVYVRAICQGNPSAWSAPLGFKTACGPREIAFLEPAEGLVYDLNASAMVHYEIAIKGCDPVWVNLYYQPQENQENLISSFRLYDENRLEGAFHIPPTLPTGTYRLLITYNQDGQEIRIPGNWFQIINQQTSITVFRPQQPDYWFKDAVNAISWNSHQVDAVNIYLSVDAGNTWQSLAEGQESHNSTWTRGANMIDWQGAIIPEGSFPRSVIKIVSAADPGVFALSEEFLVSSNPPFVVLSPGAGNPPGAYGLMDVNIHAAIDALAALTMQSDEGHYIFLGTRYLNAGPNALQLPAGELRIGESYTLACRHLLIYNNAETHAGGEVLGETFVPVKATPVIQWPTAPAIVYGETLGSALLSGGVAIAGHTPVNGGFSWEHPNRTPRAGSTSENALFIPENAERVNAVSGTIPIMVNPKALQLAGTFSVADKIYDATPLAHISQNDLSLAGIIHPDQVFIDSLRAEFSQTMPGINLDVKLAYIGLGGHDKENYTLPMQSLPTARASITGVVSEVVLHAEPPAGGSVSGHGLYLEGWPVHLTAVPNQDYRFVSWSGDISLLGNTSLASQQIVMPAQPLTLTAHFDYNTGIEEIRPMAPGLYPNPAGNQLNVRLTEEQTQVRIWVYDMMGRQWMHQHISQGQSFVLDVSGLTNGFYMLRIATNKETLTGRFQVAR